tara:strand:+ start:121 stop:669 length:549 start_codon:yes stop_codon:yes gene_type:complete
MTTIKKLVENLESVELTDSDILDITRNKTNLMVYEDLEKYNDINDVLGEHGACIILFQTKSATEGHWTLIFRSSPKTLTFFDPYGIPVDSEIKLSPFQLRIHEGKEVPHLSHLINQSEYKLLQNTTRYQQIFKNIADCGRHCCVRLLFRKYSPTRYKKFILNSFEGMNPDETVSMLTVLFSV